MKHSTKQWVSLATATALLAAGCAAGPQRSPSPNANNTGYRASSTTGDADACAVALGNSVAAGTPGTTGTTPGTTGGARMGTDAATGGNGTLGGYRTGAGTAGTTGGAGVGSAGTAPHMQVTANGILLGNVALVALPTVADQIPITGAGGAGAGGATGGAAGVGTPTGGGAAAGAAGPTAIERIRAACAQLVEIRVVDQARDKERLAEVALSIRHGEPVTRFLTELVAMNGRASTAWSKAGTAGTPGAGAAAGTGGAGR